MKKGFGDLTFTTCSIAAFSATVIASIVLLGNDIQRNNKGIYDLSFSLPTLLALCGQTLFIAIALVGSHYFSDRFSLLGRIHSMCVKNGGPLGEVCDVVVGIALGLLAIIFFLVHYL